MDKHSLLFTPKPKPLARFRLLCFPYAGGNASTYIPWFKGLHDEAEITLVQLPGRGVRFSTPPYQNMKDLVHDVFQALNQLSRKENVFFGHSMGAKIAYELTLQLYTRQYTLPIHVISSGSAAPGKSPKDEFIHTLSDQAFVERLRSINGTPEGVLENKELISLMMSMLRADFKIAETYQNKCQLKLPTTVSIFAGTNDDIEKDELESWKHLFSSNTGIHWFEGDHFFINKNKDAVLKKLNQILESKLNAPAEIISSALSTPYKT